MKKRYSKPMMACEEFTPNEYVATCVVGKCDVTSSDIYYWNDTNGNEVYDAGEKGDRVWSFIFVPLTNEACDSLDFQKVTGEIKDVTPVVCENATCETAGVSNGTVAGWKFTGQTPGGGTSTHVSSVKPFASNAS